MAPVWMASHQASRFRPNQGGRPHRAAQRVPELIPVGDLAVPQIDEERGAVVTAELGHEQSMAGRGHVAGARGVRVVDRYDPTMPRTDRASRVVAAPAAQVYAAVVDPDALTTWLPPGGMTGRFERFDLRPGGSYRLVLTYLDASAAPGKATADSDVVEARFVDVVQGIRVVQAVDFVADDPAFAGTMTMTWSVAPGAMAPRSVDFVAADVPDGITAEDHAEGMGSSLANLAAYLEGE